MAYYAGVANDFAELLTALRNACVAEGWTLTGGVLSKGNAYVKVEDVTLDANTPRSLMLTGGTGLSGSTLLEPSPATPRFGRGHNAAPAYTWPMTYSVHIFDDPAEVFFIAQFAAEYYLWAAWGLSDVPGLNGTGLWLTACCQRIYNHGYMEDPSSSYTIGPATGGSGSGVFASFKNSGPFWNTVSRYVAGVVGTYGQYYQDAIHTGLNALGAGANGWAGVPSASGLQAPGKVDAIRALVPHMARQPSSWNNEGILLPIQAYEWTVSNKCQLVLDVRNARYLRLDNYVPGQVITLGHEKWRVYPFFRRNLAARDGGSGIEHTGTFGWAIRYDGD